MRWMVFLLLDLLLALCLGIRREVELLVGERDLDLRQVLREPVLQHLHLRESSQAKCVRYRCSCGRVVALHEVKVLELF